MVPQPLRALQDLVVSRGHRVRLKEVEGYASSHYHIHHPAMVQRVPEDVNTGVRGGVGAFINPL